MKVFVFTVERLDPKKNEQGNNRKARIYRIKRNIPTMIGECDYVWGRSQGDESEVMKSLIDSGYLPKQLYNVSDCEWRGPGYYCPEIEGMGYKIVKL